MDPTILHGTGGVRSLMDSPVKPSGEQKGFVINIYVQNVQKVMSNYQSILNKSRLTRLLAGMLDFTVYVFKQGQTLHNFNSLIQEEDITSKTVK